MPEQVDNNDIVFEQYQIDFLSLFKVVYESVGGSGITFDSIVSWLGLTWTIFTFISLCVAFLCLVGLIYAYIRNSQASDLEAEIILSLIHI